ncbi:MAG TPA: hypothetical protein VE956_13880 [Nodularia sp. (in: cyanobacteria)]|nr:hypothetical protein [Nodularia sp. (in: cyanobacteria)]
MAKSFKHLLVGLTSISSIMLSSAVFADTHLETAYIQPRTLVYSGGNFRVLADNKFDGSEKALIGPAAKILHQRLSTNRSKILDCTYRRANKDFPSSRAVIDNQLRSVFVNAASGNRPIVMTVAYMWAEPGNVGRGTLGKSGQFPEKGDLLRVALNSDQFGAGATYHKSNDLDYWADVLAHEVLHNLGYNHPTGYPGSFIEEFGVCVRFNGVEPAEFGLTGSDVYDGMKK